MSFGLVNQIARDTINFVHGDKINPESPAYKEFQELKQLQKDLNKRLKNMEFSFQTGEVYKNKEQYLEAVNKTKKILNSVENDIQRITGDVKSTTVKGYSYDNDPKATPIKPETNLGKANIVLADPRWGQLSNLADHTFTWDGKEYRSVEHAYQSNKSGTFHEPTYRAYFDKPEARKINTGPPANKNINIQLMEDLYRQMLSENPDVANLLKETEGFDITHQLKKNDIWTTEMPIILTKLRDELINPVTEVKPVERVGNWTRAEVEADKGFTYLFGDNTADRGSGVVPTQTQAVIRGLDNAVGIDTRLSRTEDWTDTDANYKKFTQHVDEQIQKALDMGKPIKVSAGGMGTGKAKALPPRFKEYLDNAIKNIGTSNTSRIVPKDTPGSVLAMRGGDLPNPFYYQGGGPDAIVKISEGSTDANIAKVVELHKNWLETGAVPDGLTDDQIKRLADMREKQLNVIDNLPDDYKLGYYKPDATTSHAITLDNFIQERKQTSTQFNQVSPEANYPIRTQFNAENSDITIDFTRDASKGSGATKRSANNAGKTYQPVIVDEVGLMKNQDNIDELAKVIADNLTNGKTVNIAGHGAYKSTRAGSVGFNEAIQQSVFDNELNKIFDRVKFFIGDKPITGMVISGGQSGYDEAGIKAANKIGIPTQVNFTGEGLYRPPEALGAKDDINNAEQFRNRFNRYGPGGMPPIDTPEFGEWYAKNLEGKSDAEIMEVIAKETGLDSKALKAGLGQIPGYALVPLEQAAEQLLKTTKAAPFMKNLIKYELLMFGAMIVAGATTFAMDYASNKFKVPRVPFGNMMPGAAPNIYGDYERELPLTQNELDFVLFQDEEGNDFTVDDLLKAEAMGNAGKVIQGIAYLMPSYWLDEWLYKRNPELREDYEDKKFFSEGGWRATLAQPAWVEKQIKNFYASIMGLTVGNNE